MYIYNLYIIVYNFKTSFKLINNMQSEVNLINGAKISTYRVTRPPKVDVFKNSMRKNVCLFYIFLHTNFYIDFCLMKCPLRPHFTCNLFFWYQELEISLMKFKILTSIYLGFEIRKHTLKIVTQISVHQNLCNAINFREI